MKKNDASFLFQLPTPLLESTRNTAAENAISASAFIRQSIVKNIRAHTATEQAQTASKIHSAFLRRA